MPSSKLIAFFWLTGQEEIIESNPAYGQIQGRVVSCKSLFQLFFSCRSTS